MDNNFFNNSLGHNELTQRIRILRVGKVGFYSIGLYAASLAYNCAMQSAGDRLLLAPRPGREVLGAFSKEVVEGMDIAHIEKIRMMSTHKEGDQIVSNNLSDLILRCELVILSANSKYIESDLSHASKLKLQLKRQNVVLGCLSGSFNYDEALNEAYVLCEKEPNLAFFSGFHRHDALRNPLDSFTANFCHPNAITALLGSQLLNLLSPNIQVSAGVHNLEGQYIKSAKNIASIFAGFAHSYHKNNQGLLPTLLTLLLNQCLDQAATVSMFRKDRELFYNSQPISITELGYAVQRIEASLSPSSKKIKKRDHTFSQLTAMVADVRGSMMEPSIGKPTRNFQAGQILSRRMKELRRCPLDLNEFVGWCEDCGLKIGSLEGLKSLQYWPQIISHYAIPLNDASMNNLLYMTIFAPAKHKEIFYKVMTNTRQLTCYCQDSVHLTSSVGINHLLLNLDEYELVTLLEGLSANSQENSNLQIENHKSNLIANARFESQQVLTIIGEFFK